MRANLYKITAKITSLVRSGRIDHARHVFDEMPVRDVVAWNSMLTGYSQLGLQREALSFFQLMRASNTRPDHFTFTATLSTCACAGLLWDGAKLHASVVVSGCQASLPVNNSLIDMYGKCWRPFCAGKVFEDMSETNDVSWCSVLFAYTNCGQFDVASEVFSLMPRKIDIAWNTMISGIGRSGQIERCLDLFKEMRNSLCEPDQWTYSALMNACTESLEFFYGCMVHAMVTKSGWICAVEASNSLLSFYAKLGSIIDAKKVFKSTGMQSQVSWNAIIDAYMQGMQEMGMEKNLLASLLA